MQKSPRYTFVGRIRFSEVDHTKKITLPGIVNYFQDCSTFQSEELGLGIDH
ncbi:MAG: acyl-[acyl-carrier-protein] thioesterase, partial [Lachnospiraceae bacterium]|nr:acyl-[acyl-carrier-protein] thioesterase [Lachnospiraceae bacterium]